VTIGAQQILSGDILAKHKELTARFVETVKTPGQFADGGNLYLVVGLPKGARNQAATTKTKHPAPTKSWLFMWKPSGKNHNRKMGLGSAGAVSLELARELAAKAREQVALGLDPVKEREKERSLEKAIPTFQQCAAEFLSIKRKEFRNAKHAAQWEMTLTRYCGQIHEMPVDEITHLDLVSVLEPLWDRIPETASRLCNRIANVLTYASDKSYRTSEAENPATRARRLLPKRQKLTRGHHKALDHIAVPDFLLELRNRDGFAHRLLEFIVLTVTRTGEARLAVWSEFDLDRKIWTIPAERMKAEQEHRVPLTGRAFEIVAELAKYSSGPSDFVFPGQRDSRPLSNMAPAMVIRRMSSQDGAPAQWEGITPHGFRSSFRDWCAEETSYPRWVAEKALAHTIGNETERAYQRGDLLKRRRELMSAWDSFCAPSEQSNIVPISRRQS